MNREQARDLIYTHGTAAFNAALEAAGVPPEAPRAMRYQGVAEAEPAQGSYWGRISMQTVDEPQETLRNGETRRFATYGIVMFQIFVPRQSGQELVEIDRISEHLRNAYRDRQVDDNLEFTGAKIDDNVRTETSWLNVLVTTRFGYDQFI